MERDLQRQIVFVHNGRHDIGRATLFVRTCGAIRPPDHLVPYAERLCVLLAVDCEIGGTKKAHA
jgi:hypothetical protein